GLASAPLSTEGRFLAVASTAADLVPGDTNGLSDIFVFDRQTQTTQRVSVDAAGNQAQGGSGSFSPSISGDGRYVAFVSDAANLVPGDSNNAPDVFVYDRQTGTIERVSVDSAGNQALGGFGSPSNFVTALSADGQLAAFDTAATN